jgi:hypothetical protein
VSSFLMSALPLFALPTPAIGSLYEAVRPQVEAVLAVRRGRNVHGLDFLIL